MFCGTKSTFPGYDFLKPKFFRVRFFRHLLCFGTLRDTIFWPIFALRQVLGSWSSLGLGGGLGTPQRPRERLGHREVRASQIMQTRVLLLSYGTGERNYGKSFGLSHRSNKK